MQRANDRGEISSAAAAPTETAVSISQKRVDETRYREIVAFLRTRWRQDHQRRKPVAEREADLTARPGGGSPWTLF